MNIFVNGAEEMEDGMLSTDGFEMCYKMNVTLSIFIYFSILRSV